MMVSVFVGTSLDGFIARANGDFDFLPEGGGEPHGYNEFMASVDALLLGRNTFEKVFPRETALLLFVAIAATSIVGLITLLFGSQGNEGQSDLDISSSSSKNKNGVPSGDNHDL